jgi:hypothetical protein
MNANQGELSPIAKKYRREGSIVGWNIKLKEISI